MSRIDIGVHIHPETRIVARNHAAMPGQYEAFSCVEIGDMTLFVGNSSDARRVIEALENAIQNLEPVTHD